MARFLLAVWPYTGHVYPNIALANALRKDGHEVAFFSGALARGAIEREGFRYFPFDQLAHRLSEVVGRPPASASALVDTPDLYEQITERYTAAFDQGALGRAKQLKAMYQEWILGTAPQQIADIQAILAAWPADVLVSDPFMWGPILVLHELLPLPVAVFSYFAACLLPGPDAPPVASGLPKPRTWRTRTLAQLNAGLRDLFFTDIRRGANVLRRQYGLRSLPTPVMSFAGRLPLYLVASVPEFDYERHDLPPSVHYAGPCLWDKPSTEPAPTWLTQMPADPPIVYVTEGTANSRTPVLLQAAYRGLANRPLQVIMTTGKQRDPALLDLGPIAPNIRVERWVPHSDLLPRVSAVVAIGGSGTVLSTLQAGLPMVVVPLQWDQVENAQRVVEAGAGIQIPAQQCTPARIRAAVEQLLSDPTFRRNAERLAAIFKQYDGPAGAAVHLEALAKRHSTTPQPALQSPTATL